MLSYDNGCGPCTLFARAARALARGRLEIAGLLGPVADRAFAGIDPEDRFSWMRLRIGERVLTHTEALIQLIGVVLGATAMKGIHLVRPAEWGLRAFYHWLHKVRTSRGCPLPGRIELSPVS